MIQMSKNGSDPYSPLRYPILRWPRELNALQIEKNTCKLRKQLSQFYTAHTANAHNTTKKENYANRKKACKLLFFYDFFFFLVNQDIYRDGSSKNENYVNNYSTSCHSKPVRP